MLDDYLQKYIDAFDENFPIYGFMGIPENEIIQVIQKCLDENKPYNLELKDGVYY